MEECGNGGDEATGVEWRVEEGGCDECEVWGCSCWWRAGGVGNPGICC